MPTRFPVSTVLLAAACLAAAGPSASADPPKPKMTLATYCVADLVTPLVPGPVHKAPAAMVGGLVKLILGTVEPMTWEQAGGRGTIDFCPRTMSLVVNQTADIQEQVADFLAALRRLPDQPECCPCPKEKPSRPGCRDAACPQPAAEMCPKTAAEARQHLFRHVTQSLHQARVLGELLRAYDEACADGRAEEAEKLARAALILDPTCFRRK